MNKRINHYSRVFAWLAIVLVSVSATAQTKIPVYKIMHGIETNVQAELAGHPEWGFARLRSNIHATVSMAAARQMQFETPGETLLTPQELYKKRQESALVFGKMYVCGECPRLHVSLIATATAVTGDGVCLTNYHVVHPIVSGDPALCTGDSVYFVADRDGQIYPLTEVVAFSREEDAAVIRVDTKGARLSAVPLGTPAETGQHINLISHPKQMLFMYTQGYVTRNVQYAYPDRPVLDLMEVSADFAEGSSGGPVMDDYGNLVAMVKGTNTIYYDEERRTPQMVLKVTIPVSRLRRLLGQK